MGWGSSGWRYDDWEMKLGCVMVGFLVVSMEMGMMGSMGGLVVLGGRAGFWGGMYAMLCWGRWDYDMGWI